MSDDKCPYNPSHVFLPHRKHMHLLKCKKQYPHIKLNICPFNNLHHVKDAEFANHKLTCEDREVFLHLKESISHAQEENSANATNVQQPQEQPADEWETECGAHSYSAQEHTKKLPILRSNVGMTKAEKKKFKEEERQRIEELDKRDN